MGPFWGVKATQGFLIVILVPKECHKNKMLFLNNLSMLMAKNFAFDFYFVKAFLPAKGQTTF